MTELVSTRNSMVTKCNWHPFTYVNKGLMTHIKSNLSSLTDRLQLKV